MRKFGKIELSNRNYERIIRRYIQFYENQNKCSDQCPVFIGGYFRWLDHLTERLWEDEDPLMGKCFCNQLPMFSNHGCPCQEMSERAFKALELFIKKYGKEFM